MSYKLFCLGADHSDRLDLLSHDLPCDIRNVLRKTAVDLSFEIFNDLRSADFPPLLCILYFLAVLGRHQVRNHRVWISLAFVVIGCIWAALVSIESASDGLDSELVKHVLVVLFGCERHGLLCEGCRTYQAGRADE